MASPNARLKTTVCVVGAGPAGVITSYMLAQQGIDVLLLESHRDFDRDFRGDTIHSGVMELLDQMGLAEGLFELPHAKMRQLFLNVREESIQVVDFSSLKNKFPFVTMMPQSQFLTHIVDKARSFANFEIRMGARAEELSNGTYGYNLEFRQNDAQFTVEANLIIGTDGRHSKIRKCLGLEPTKAPVPMDVIWFRVSRTKDDGIRPGGYIGRGHILFVLERSDEWQVGYIFLHGSFRNVKQAGFQEFKDNVTATNGELGAAMLRMTDWHDVSVLSVESSCLKKWHDKNVLLIGDAAHVMSPVGGVGINYAIMDAIAAVGVLAGPIRAQRLDDSVLGRVQKRRKWPTWTIQTFQSIVQRQIVAAALGDGSNFRIPWILRFKFARRIVARLISHGWWTVKVPAENQTRDNA